MVGEASGKGYKPPITRFQEKGGFLWLNRAHLGYSAVARINDVNLKGAILLRRRMRKA